MGVGALSLGSRSGRGSGSSSVPMSGESARLGSFFLTISLNLPMRMLRRFLTLAFLASSSGPGDGGEVGGASPPLLGLGAPLGPKLSDDRAACAAANDGDRG